MKKLIILLGIFLFLFVAGVSFAGESNSTQLDAYYIVSIKPAPKLKCKKVAEGAGPVEVELRRRLEAGYTITVPQRDIILLHKNPTCIINLGGVPVCWCCPE